MSWTEFEETQNLDEDISLVKRWALNGRRPDKKPDDASPMLKSLFNVFESLVVEKNVLCRNWVDEEGKGTLQIVVPKFASPAIMKDAHQQVGHLGIAKTFEMIQRGFYWPGFYKDVETFCKSCEICARNKVVPRPRSPMKPIDIVPVPFYMVGVDLIGPLKLTRQGNKYILSIIDYYTKYAEAIALPNQEAETVVRALEQVFARHGMPSVLLTDQGRNFESHLVTSMCELFGIEKRRTTAYHPQTDGLCERFNGILKSLLRMRVNNDKDDWDEQLPNALLAYRVSKQSSTGVTPFEMLYGRDARLPLGVESKEVVAKPTHGPAKYLEDLKKRQNALREIVIERIEQSQKKQKHCYDSRNRAQRSKGFTIGDTVPLKNFRARGLEEKYIGPYLVVGIRDTSCKIESLANKTRKVVHANNLKRFSIDYNIEAYEESEDTEGSEYDVDEIEEPQNPEERRNNPRNEDDVNAMQERYNLRRNQRMPDRYGIPIMDY